MLDAGDSMITQILYYLLVAFSLLCFLILLLLDASKMFSKNSEEVFAPEKYNPKVLVMVPCRGIDLTLEQNLKAVKSQSYKNYDLITIVDDEKDSAVALLNKLKIKWIVSNAKCRKCSGKVRAMATAIEKFRNYDVYVNMDSDVCVGKHWLSSLIKPLSQDEIGLSTMYPYFKPLSGFWSEVKMMWGFVGDSLLENPSSRFGWGGSLAFKNGLMDKKSIDFFKNSEYSVSDDVCITKIVKSKGLRIAYVREPKPVINCKETFATFFEWANRQTALTVMGYRKNLKLGLVYYSMEIVTLVSGILLSIFVSPIFLILLLHYLRSVIVGYRRAGFASFFLPIIVFIMPFMYDINLVRAARMKSITWRGREYELGA